jgi:hypothetical protein
LSAIAQMIEAARTSETSVDNYFTRQYIPEDKSELHTRRRENLKSHENVIVILKSAMCTSHTMLVHLIIIIIIIWLYSPVRALAFPYAVS